MPPDASAPEPALRPGATCRFILRLRFTRGGPFPIYCRAPASGRAVVDGERIVVCEEHSVPDTEPAPGEQVAPG